MSISSLLRYHHRILNASLSSIFTLFTRPVREVDFLLNVQKLIPFLLDFLRHESCTRPLCLKDWSACRHITFPYALVCPCLAYGTRVSVNRTCSHIIKSASNHVFLQALCVTWHSGRTGLGGQLWVTVLLSACPYYTCERVTLREVSESMLEIVFFVCLRFTFQAQDSSTCISC